MLISIWSYPLHEHERKFFLKKSASNSRFFTLFKTDFRYRKIEEARFATHDLLQRENGKTTAGTLPFSFSSKGKNTFSKVEMSGESLKIENSTKASLKSNRILTQDSQIVEKKSLVKSNINKISKIHTYTITRPLINMRSLMQISKTKFKSSTRLTKTKSLSVVRSNKTKNEKTHSLVGKASSVLQITRKFLNENPMVSLETLKSSTSKSQISTFNSSLKDEIVRNRNVRNKAIKLEEPVLLKSAKIARINDVKENTSKSKDTDILSKKSLFKSKTENFKFELNVAWEDENNSKGNKRQDSKHSLSTLFSTSTLLDKENTVRVSLGENSTNSSTHNNKDLSERDLLVKNKKPAIFNTNIEGIKKMSNVFLLESSAESALNSSLESFLQLAKRKVSNFSLTSSNVNLDENLSKSAF